MPWDFHLPPLFFPPGSLETQQGSVCRKMLNISASDLWKEEEFVLGAGSRAAAGGGVSKGETYFCVDFFMLGAWREELSHAEGLPLSGAPWGASNPIL